MRATGRLTTARVRVQGDFEHNVMQGRGKYTWPDGCEYDGEWHAGLMHGEGRFTDSSARTWHGRFANGAGPGLVSTD